MIDVDAGRFTVGVFQDVAWAQKGLDALAQAGFPREALTILAKDSPDAAALIERALGAAGERIEVAGVGAGRRARAAGGGAAGQRAATSPSSASRARCGASASRRTTAGSSRR